MGIEAARTGRPLGLCHHLAFILFLTALAACGQVKLGPATANDAAPDGTVVAQGNFSGMNGKTVTGIAQVYRATDNQYVIRLQGLSAPNENALEVYAIGSETFRSGLRSISGTQNYWTGITSYTTWSTVYIRTTTTSFNPEYGVATLTSPK